MPPNPTPTRRGRTPPATPARASAGRVPRPGADPARRQELLPIHVLQAVAAVGETGSMSAAGERLGMTQSAVSQSIKQAEAMLGVALFDRDRRPIRPTSAGHLLWRRAETVLHELQVLPSTLRSARTVPELRLALSDSFADTMGPWLIRAAAEIAHNLYVSQGFTPEHVRELAERRVDIVVAADSHDEIDGLSRYPLLREPLVLLLPAGSQSPGAGAGVGEAAARGGAAVARPELVRMAQKLPLIRYSAKSTTGTLVDRFLRRLDVGSARRIEVDNASVMCALVGSGSGWAVTTPLHVLQGAAHLDGVVVRPAAAQAPSREVTLITRSGELEALALRLAREARSILREHGLPAIRRHVPWLGDEIAVLGV